MSALLQRIKEFMRSPRGKQLMERGRREIAKPSNQQRLRELRARWGKRR